MTIKEWRESVNWHQKETCVTCRNSKTVEEWVGNLHPVYRLICCIKELHFGRSNAYTCNTTICSEYKRDPSFDEAFEKGEIRG